MDKFDKRMKEAREVYIPSADFVDRTMTEVKKHKIRRPFSIRRWAPALAGVFAVLVVAVVLAPKPTSTNVVDGSKIPQHSKKVAQSGPTDSPAPISDGTDNASLDRDLGSVASSMNQTSTDQSGAESAVNDNQQQISIPN